MNDHYHKLYLEREGFTPMLTDHGDRVELMCWAVDDAHPAPLDDTPAAELPAKRLTVTYRRPVEVEGANDELYTHLLYRKMHSLIRKENLYGFGDAWRGYPGHLISLLQYERSRLTALSDSDKGPQV